MANLEQFLSIMHVYPPVINVGILTAIKSFDKISENKFKFLNLFPCLT